MARLVSCLKKYPPPPSSRQNQTSQVLIALIDQAPVLASRFVNSGGCEVRPGLRITRTCNGLCWHTSVANFGQSQPI